MLNYPAFKLALEFREGQHYSGRFAFVDNRPTATKETRKEQRKKYDKRREEVLPAKGIKLLIIYDFELTKEKNYKRDLCQVKEKLKEFSHKMLVGQRIDDICKELGNG